MWTFAKSVARAARVWAGAVFLALGTLILTPPVWAQSGACDVHHPEARRALPSDRYYEHVNRVYGNVCTLVDRDRSVYPLDGGPPTLDMGYYQRSENTCRSMPGFITWEPDRGAGYSLCLFEPPQSGAPATAGGGAPPPLLPGAGGPNSCAYAYDGECDEPVVCATGTDTYDCRAPSPPASPPPARQATETSELTFCNETAQSVNVALGYHETDSFVIIGWYVLAPWGCQRVGTFRRDLPFYFHAFNDSAIWEGDRTYCINIRTRYRRVNTPNYTCRDDEELRGFRQRNFDSASHTVRLTPPS